MSIKEILIARFDVKHKFVRKAYNTRLVSWLFSQLRFEAELDINHPKVQKALKLGTIRAYRFFKLHGLLFS